MIGLDTNVLVRYIVQDDRVQARAATRLIEAECSADDPGFVSLLVMVELVWVLESAYGYARADVCAVLATLLATAEIRVEDPEGARTVLQVFASGPADFADYLIGWIHASHGCLSTYTFDKRAAKSGWHTLVA